MKSLFFSLASLSIVTTVFAASIDETLIRDAKVYTVSAGIMDHTDVLIRDGRITALGSNLRTSSGAASIEAHGLPLTPGIFGGLLQIGVDEISEEPSTVDDNLIFKAHDAEQQWRPEFDVTLAFNPQSTRVPIARIEGVTWTVLTPEAGDTVLSGQGAAVALDGRPDAELPGTRALFLVFGIEGKKRSGGSRAGLYMLLDEAMREARSTGPLGDRALLHLAGREVLSHYLSNGRMVFEVERASDILQVIKFAHRKKLRPIIFGGSEGWRVAKELAAAHVPVILNPLQDLPYDFDRLGARLDNAALLERAGVLIAFSPDNHDPRLMRQLAGNAVAHGLPWDAALAAITRNPADMFGLDATHGRIAAGQTADLVLWDGDPLEVTTIATQVWINGQRIQMRSRQTELRDRYLKAGTAR